VYELFFTLISGYDGTKIIEIGQDLTVTVKHTLPHFYGQQCIFLNRTLHLV